MAGNNRTLYNVDLVFCIDCTESMDNILNIIKSRALSFYSDIQTVMQAKGKRIDLLRARVVAFRDYDAYDLEKKRGAKGNYPMLVSDFFTLPGEADKLEISVKSLYPIGGGDEAEDGLEALAYAIRSDWNHAPGAKARHVIVLWTDAEPHDLGTGRNSSLYPRGMAENMSELTFWWGNTKAAGYMEDQAAKRLILFAPEGDNWSFIAANWDNVIHFPSKAGDGLRDVDYETILACIANTIG